MLELRVMTRTLLIVVSLVGLQIATAHADIQLAFPLQRYSDQKNGPCGHANDTRSETINIFAPGEIITVSWDETVNHPGHFRIAFDDDGHDAFQDPLSENTCDTTAPILADCIIDLPDGGGTSYDITLPDIECENCTLQVIQVITDKLPFGDGNDIYYQCADLALRAGASDNDGGPDNPDADAGADAGPGPDTGNGGDCQSGGSPAPAILVSVLGLFAFTRRRGLAPCRRRVRSRQLGTES